MNTPTASLLTATALILAACGGSDDASDDAATTTSPTTTATPTTTTAPTTTAAPTTTLAPTTTEAPTTTAAAAPDLTEYCSTSEEYYVTVTALNTVDTNGAAGVLIPLAIQEADAVIDAAPGPEFAGEPTTARDALIALNDLVAPIGYDVEQLEDRSLLSAPLEGIDQTTAALEEFLPVGCESDLTALAERATALATSLDENVGESAPASSVPDVDAASGATIDVSDDSGQLFSSVPAEWSDVRGAPNEGIRQLLASTDVDAFLEGYNLPGLYLLSGDAPDADAAWRAAKAGGVAAAEADGCQVQISAPYEDALYTGQEDLLSCPGGDSTLHAIGGANSANDVWFVVLLVLADGDTTTRDLIVDTFTVD